MQRAANHQGKEDKMWSDQRRVSQASQDLLGSRARAARNLRCHSGASGPVTCAWAARAQRGGAAGIFRRQS